jgi:hypothetical protein
MEQVSLSAIATICTGLLQVSALIFFLGKQSQIFKTHSELHTEHKKKLDEHAAKLSTHEKDIAVIQASLD